MPSVSSARVFSFTCGFLLSIYVTLFHVMVGGMVVLKNTIVAPWRLGAHSAEEGANDPPVGPSVG